MPDAMFQHRNRLAELATFRLKAFVKFYGVETKCPPVASRRLGYTRDRLGLDKIKNYKTRADLARTHTFRLPITSPLGF
jgi:hypothetical protein